MTTRSGMANLILEARRLAGAGSGDYTINGVTYWTDEQIQSILDKQAVRVYTHNMTYIEDSDTDYIIPAQYVERAGADSGWLVKDSYGDTVGTALYSVNYEAQVITFGTATSGSAYFLNYREYNLNNAVGDIWEAKAGYYADLVSFASDNHRVELSDKYNHAQNMADKFHNTGVPVRVLKRIRTDEVR